MNNNTTGWPSDLPTPNLSEFSEKQLIANVFVTDLDEEEREAVTFCFYIAYFAETTLKNILTGTMTAVIKEKLLEDPKTKDFIDKLIEEHYFSGKIGIFKSIASEKYIPFINLLGELRDLRNAIAHGRLKGLKFREKLVKDQSTRQLIINVVFDAIKKSMTPPKEHVQ